MAARDLVESVVSVAVANLPPPPPRPLTRVATTRIIHHGGASVL